MFKLTASPTFTVMTPLSVPGIPEPVGLQMTFRHKNAAAVAAWIKGAEKKPDVEFLHEVIVGWDGLQDNDGSEVPYSLAELGTLLNNYPPASGEILRTYLRELTEAKRKN